MRNEATQDTSADLDVVLPRWAKRRIYKLAFLIFLSGIIWGFALSRLTAAQQWGLADTALLCGEAGRSADVPPEVLVWCADRARNAAEAGARTGAPSGDVGAAACPHPQILRHLCPANAADQGGMPFLQRSTCPSSDACSWWRDTVGACRAATNLPPCPGIAAVCGGPPSVPLSDDRLLTDLRIGEIAWDDGRLEVGWAEELQLVATTASVQSRLAARFEKADRATGPDGTNRDAARIATLRVVAEWNGDGFCVVRRGAFAAHHRHEFEAVSSILAIRGGMPGDLWDAPGGCPAAPVCPPVTDPAPGSCGNGVIDAGELCDGAATFLDCATAGLGPGTVTCLSDCSGFDTSGCEGDTGDEEPPDLPPVGPPEAPRVFIRGELLTAPGDLYFSEWKDFTAPHPGPLWISGTFRVPPGAAARGGKDQRGLVYAYGLERRAWNKGAGLFVLSVQDKGPFVLRVIGPDDAKAKGGAEGAPKVTGGLSWWVPADGGTVTIDGEMSAAGAAVDIVVRSGGRTGRLRLEVDNRSAFPVPGVGLQCSNPKKGSGKDQPWIGVGLECEVTEP